MTRLIVARRKKITMASRTSQKQTDSRTPENPSGLSSLSKTRDSCGNQDSQEVGDDDEIGEHDHLFGVRMRSEEDIPYNTALEIIHRSAIAHSLVGFTYKWGRHLEETSEVCLLLLCSVEGLMIYYKITVFTIAIPEIILEILRDENICKVGAFYGELIKSGPTIQINNALDIRYVAQMSGFAPLNLTGLIKSVLKYTVNLYRGTRRTEKYFMRSNFQIRSVSLEVFFCVSLYLSIRQHYNLNFEIHHEDLSNVYKDKKFRYRTHMS